MSALATHVERAVSHAFDEFTRRMDRFVLEEYTTPQAITSELHRQGLIDFADMWETYIAEGEEWA